MSLMGYNQAPVKMNTMNELCFNDRNYLNANSSIITCDCGAGSSSECDCTDSDCIMQ